MVLKALPPDKQPACRDQYELVDAAFGGSRAANLAKTELYDSYCVHCPVATECLELALKTKSLGPWAGTNKNYGAGNGKRSRTKRTPINMTRKKATERAQD